MSTTNEVATSNSNNTGGAAKDTQGAEVASKPRAIVYEKEIRYDRFTRDYAMYLDGELMGFGRTYHEAEVELDRLVFELLNGWYFPEAA